VLSWFASTVQVNISVYKFRHSIILIFELWLRLYSQKDKIGPFSTLVNLRPFKLVDLKGRYGLKMPHLLYVEIILKILIFNHWNVKDGIIQKSASEANVNKLDMSLFSQAPDCVMSSPTWVWVALALTSIKQWREAVLDSLRQVESSTKPVLKIPGKIGEKNYCIRLENISNNIFPLSFNVF
jgi:hypothetical protein